MQYSAYNETVTTVTPAEVKVEAKLFEQEERLPTIYDAQVLEQAGEVNGVSGLEKELLVTDVDSGEEPFVIDKDGNGTVKVVVSGENRMPVDEEILQTCKNNIIENAPIGATLTVLTTTLFNVSINLSISIDESYDSSDVKLAVENAIKSYIGTCVDKIYYNKLGAKILSCDGVIDYTVLTINGSSSSVINIPADNVAVVTNINTSISEGVVYE